MKVTVIIPSYNHKHFVAEAIHSVMGQSLTGSELIVIDDGSTDGSKEVISDLYRQYDGSFRFIDRDNRGLVATLAEGLDLAQGEYCCELASDDYLHPDSLAERAKYLDANPDVVAVFTDGIRVDSQGKPGGRITKDKVKQLYRSKDPVAKIIDNITPTFATAMIRTQALRDCGGYDWKTFRFYEDIDTPVRLCALGSFGYIDEPLFYRRIHDTNVSGVTSHIRREKILFYQKMLRSPDMAPYQALLKKRLRRGVMALARTLIRQDSLLEEDYELLDETIRRYPFDLRLRWYGFQVRQKYSRQNPAC